MALTDPRSVIREILSRRPDLHAAFAPQLSAAGIQVAGLGTSGLGGRSSPYGTFEETRGIARSPQAFAGSRVLDAADLAIPPSQKPFSSGLARQRLDAAIRTRNAPPASGPIPPNMGNMGAYVPASGKKDLFSGDEFTPEELGVLVPRETRPPVGSPGQPPSDLQPFSPPGSWGALRERQAQLPGERDRRLTPPSPPGAGQPPSDLQPFTSASLASLGGAGPSPPQIASLLAPGGIAPGVGQPQGPPTMPNGPPRIPQPRPDNPFGVPQARPPQPYDAPEMRPSNVPPAQFASLPNGPRDLTPGIRAYSGQESRLPRARPDIPQGPTPPLSISGGPVPPNMGDMPNYEPQTAGRQPPPASPPPIAGFDPASPSSRPTSPLTPNLRGQRLDLTQGTSPPGLQIGSTSLSPLVQDYATGDYTPPGTQPAQLARMPRPRPPIEQQPGDLIAKPALPPTETAPLGADITGTDLPAPGSTSSILTPQQIQRTMGAQALYNQPPPGMVLPLGVTQQDVGRLGFGATNIDPSKAPVQRYGSNTGKYAGAALGALKGLAGGPVGAAVGGYLGYKGGKRLGGLADRDFGLGARFRNPNYPQGVVANPPAIMDMGVPPITQAPPPPPPAQSGGLLGGIFGSGRNALGAIREKVAGMVKRGEISAAQGASMLRDAAGSSVSGGNWGSGGRSMNAGGGYGGYGGGFGGGGGYGGGGTYGGSGGAGINQGIGQRFGNR